MNNCLQIQVSKEGSTIAGLFDRLRCWFKYWSDFSRISPVSRSSQMSVIVPCPSHVYCNLFLILFIVSVLIIIIVYNVPLYYYLTFKLK